jgi:hypothetical protein
MVNGGSAFSNSLVTLMTPRTFQPPFTVSDHCHSGIILPRPDAVNLVLTDDLKPQNSTSRYSSGEIRPLPLSCTKLAIVNFFIAHLHESICPP